MHPHENSKSCNPHWNTRVLQNRRYQEDECRSILVVHWHGIVAITTMMPSYKNMWECGSIQNYAGVWQYMELCRSVAVYRNMQECGNVFFFFHL